ncbi:bacteriocin secretion protein [Streptococcus sp. OH4692_COT-348]|uniref:bacteriocin secretion protein n=1 Tax=Streptococcus sp. OH4692_COT-348 TaxID=2491052 RepID=UPI000F5EB3F6|nr:bacteriocin secretion protein [Streptococcus sp. OH4692_COT-348]RRD33844.1 bacteriocin secretion protein [Streptococcus sp. OH4692_COT-348]
MNSSINQFSILKNSDLQEYSGGLNPTCGVLVGMSIYIGLTAFTAPVGVALRFQQVG